VAELIKKNDGLHVRRPDVIKFESDDDYFERINYSSAEIDRSQYTAEDGHTDTADHVEVRKVSKDLSDADIGCRF
jgi:hypothetical protein